MARIAVFGGVYANTRALRAVIADARERGADRVVCLGDLGGFGADPDGVFAPLIDAGVECIAGNYDLAIAAGDDDCGCGYTDPRDNAFAQVMYDFTRARTSAAFAAWMADLPGELRETIGGLDVHMVHGSPLAVNDFFWRSLSREERSARVAASGADVLLCTHTGIPWVERIDGCLVVNVGTVGRSANDGDPRGRYALLDIAGGRAEARILPVDHDASAHAADMRRAGLPEEFALAAETGWWTTCLEVVPPPERARGRFHCYRDAVPGAAEDARTGWSSAVVEPDDGLPVVSLFGSAAFPARLWIYTNFHCNLACGYCAVASSPLARRRSLGAARVAELVDEAVAAGFVELCLTGGEPFLEPDIIAMVAYAADRLPTTVLTNAMLLDGPRGRGLAALSGHPRLVIQTSLDGATPAAHDALRGSGSFRRTIEGIAAAQRMGLRVRVSTTETRENRHEMAAMTAMLNDLGIPPEAHAVRPLLARGGSDEGVVVERSGLVPELTVTADGVHWHPAGADAETSPDLIVARGRVSLADARRMVIEDVLAQRQADGTLPRPYVCAI